MQLSLAQIETELTNDTIAPRTLAEYRVYLAALFSQRGSEMGGLEQNRASKWLAIREHKKSDAAADREWDTTEGGQRMIALKWELRRIEQLINAISSRIRVAEMEARNQA